MIYNFKIQLLAYFIIYDIKVSISISLEICYKALNWSFFLIK